MTRNSRKAFLSTAADRVKNFSENPVAAGGLYRQKGA
jgi:hypothetical protein